MKIPPLLNSQTPGVQLISLFLLMTLSMALSGLVAFLVIRPLWQLNIYTDTAQLSDYADASVNGARRVLLAFNQIGIFLLPAVLLNRLISLPGQNFVKTDRKMSAMLIPVTVLTALALFAPNNFLAHWNAQLTLPESMAGLEAQIIKLEEQSYVLTQSILQNGDWLVLLANLVVFALIPAIGEELFFRGALQQLFVRIIKNPHIAIAVGAFVFSFFHFQFYGFVPRMLSGLVLGYLFYYTGNLRYSMLLHFVVNALAVVLSFLIARGELPQQVEWLGTTPESHLLTLLSGLVLIAGVVWIVKKGRKT